MDTRLATPARHAAAIVWLDRRHAIVARAHEGHSTVTEIDRDADPAVQYLLRVAHEAADCDRVEVRTRRETCHLDARVTHCLDESIAARRVEDAHPDIDA